MPELTVTMIVRDEAHCLGDCLDSVRDIADAQVIGDTGSRDATPEIARARGARVLDVPWNDDFAEARNTVLAGLTRGWALHLDADEVVDPDAASRIRALVDANGEGHDAVELVLRNYCNTPRAWRWRPVTPGDPYARGFAGCLPVGLLRLFRADRGFAYREPVHENITESVRDRGGRVLVTDIPVHHYGYDPGSARGRDKVRRYLDIARRKLAGNPGDLKALHDLAEQALACGREDEAEAACRRAVALDPCSVPAVSTLANILLGRGELAEARPLLETLATRPPTPPHVLVALAAIDLREGHPADARRRLGCALAADPQAVLARLYLARALDCLGEVDAAGTALEAARRIAPALDEVRKRIDAHRLRETAGARMARGDAEGALAALVQALRLDPEDPLLHNDTGVVQHALGAADRARASFERALALCAGLEDAAANLAALDG